MLDRLLGNYMLEKGMLDKAQLQQAYRDQDANRAKLGVIAVSEKLMTIAQAEQVNALQASMDRRFGDIAIEKGYLTEAQLGRLLELQKNSYLAFAQSLIDEGYLTYEQIDSAESEYQQIYGLTETDMNDLKEGDVDRIIPIFLGTEDERCKRVFTMGIKNLYRLVDNHIYVGKAYKTSSVRGEVLAYQGYVGDESAKTAISGKYEDVQKMAIAYTKEEFIETREDALDAVCELINCMNGLYASEMSKNGVKIELEPPEFFVGYSEVKADEVVVMPVFVSGGEVKYIISLENSMEVN